MTRRHARSIPTAPKPPAFTLVELVLVVAILGVVAAIAIPRFASATTRYRLDLAAARIEGDAVLAAEWARAAGVAHVMSIDTSGDGYTIVVGADGSGATRADVSLRADPYGCDIQAVSVSSGGSKLIFDGYGRPEAGVSVTLAVGDRTRTVTLTEAIIRPEPPEAEPEDDAAEPIDLLDLPKELLGGLLGRIGG